MEEDNGYPLTIGWTDHDGVCHSVTVSNTDEADDVICRLVDANIPYSVD